MSQGGRDGYHVVGDGIRLHYREYGARSERAPLLCLHGLTRNGRDFDDLARRMASSHHVIVPDFRGRGLSGHDPEPARYVPVTYAHDMIALLDHLGIADAVIVGTSLGGLVAMLLAVLDEDRVAAAVLNDVGPELEPAGIERIRGYVGKAGEFRTWGEAAQAARAINRGLPGHWSAAQWEAMARRLMSEREDGQIRPDYDPAIAVPFNAPPGEPVDLWPMFDALAMKPVLVLRGEHSDLLSAAALERMAAHSPNVRTATIPGIGHAPDLSEPEAKAAIDEVLALVGG